MSNKLSLFKKMVKHYKQEPVSFHVPGHKSGKAFNPKGKKIYNNLLKIDLTEITGLDYLHQPKEIILESQQNLSEIFHSDYSFFLINGSTSGNLAMILTAIKPGEKIIVQSNVHKSVIDGLFLAKANPIYIDPEIIPQLGISGSISIDSLARVLKEHRDVKAVIITNPNYYGFGIDITEMANLVHQHKIPLLVDEAHGAHFGFHTLFPSTSLRMGADIVVQSTHKTLSAMTMGSVLHVKSEYIDIERLKLFLTMFQSSSPSYPIMASIELTYDWIKKKGEVLWDKQLKVVKWLYMECNNLENIRLVTDIDKRYFKDPLKIIIQSQNSSITGYNIQTLLEEREIYIEFADLYNALAIVTFGNSIKDIKRLYKALNEIDIVFNKALNSNNTNMFRITKDFNFKFNYNRGKGIPLEKILNGAYKRIPIIEAIGEISAEMITAYPPGIPIINYGEVITTEVIDYLLLLKDNGAKIHGLNDETFNYIKVLDITNNMID